MRTSPWRCSCGVLNTWVMTSCEGCGKLRPEQAKQEQPKPAPTERQTPEHLREGYAATPAEAERFMGEIRERLGVELPNTITFTNQMPGAMTRDGVTVEFSTKPICAWCVKPAADSVLRDGRLWHRGCWSQRMKRVKETRQRARTR